MATEPIVTNRTNGRSSLHMKKELPEMGLTVNAFGDVPEEVVGLIKDTLELLTTGVIPKREGYMSNAHRERTRDEQSARSQGNGGRARAGSTTASKPVCPNCQSDEAVELIRWNDKATGKPRTGWKCQACENWVWPDKR